MKNIRQIITLVTQKRIKKVELFDERSRSKNSNYYQLFEGIRSGRYDSDQAAAADIYQCGSTEKRYLILKTRLKQKLLNTLFFLDLDDPDVARYKTVAYECNKALFNAKALLLNEAAVALAVPALEKALRQAQQLFLTEIELETARLLRLYASRHGSYKDFLRYCELTTYAENRLHIENQAERAWQETQVLRRKFKLGHPRIGALTRQGYEALEPSLNLFASPRLMMNYYRLKYTWFQLSADHEQALRVMVETEHFARSHPDHFTRHDVARLVLKKLNCLLHLRDLPRATETLAAAGPCFTEGDEAWTTLQEYHFLLAMHVGAYPRAGEVFQKVTTHGGFRRLRPLRRARWQVYHAYLDYFCRHAGQPALRPCLNNARTDFHLATFLEQSVPYSKQKRGLNVAQLTVQALYRLEKMDTAGLCACIDALARYVRRYPKRDLHFRSECFINLLVNMRQQQFRHHHTLKTSARTFDHLRQTHLQYPGGSRALEVVPFEAAWELVLDRLRTIPLRLKNAPPAS